MSEETTITERFIEPEEQLDDHADYTATESRPASPHLISSWLADVKKQLKAIISLPNGWDSYGAPSPNGSFLKGAWSLIDCLSEVPGVPKPRVNPTRNGGVQFEWEAGDRYFELEVVAERAATYLYCDDAAGVEKTGNVFEQESLESVLGYIRRVGTLQ